MKICFGKRDETLLKSSQVFGKRLRNLFKKMQSVSFARAVGRSVDGGRPVLLSPSVFARVLSGAHSGLPSRRLRGAEASRTPWRGARAAGARLRPAPPAPGARPAWPPRDRPTALPVAAETEAEADAGAAAGPTGSGPRGTTRTPGGPTRALIRCTPTTSSSFRPSRVSIKRLLPHDSFLSLHSYHGRVWCFSFFWMVFAFVFYILMVFHFLSFILQNPRKYTDSFALGTCCP